MKYKVHYERRSDRDCSKWTDFSEVLDRKDMYMADKDIPGCYDPVYQAERLAIEQDKLMENTVCCNICRRTLYPGDKIHVAYNSVVCPSCMEELADNLEIV